MVRHRKVITRSLLATVWVVSMLLIPAFALAQDEQEVSITLTEFKITPSEVTVQAGKMVHFTVHNGGTVEHNFVVELEDAGIEQELFETNLQPGEARTADYTFPEAGDWEMYCPVDGHKDHGMMGDLEVTSSESVGMPSTGEGSPAGVLLLGLIALVSVCLGILMLSKARQART